MPAAGVGGLYTVTVSADFYLTGSSSTGGSMVGVLAARTVMSPEGEARPFVDFLTPPVGEPVTLRMSSGIDGAAVGRLIVLNDVAAVVGRNQRRREGGDTDYSWWEIDF